MGKKKKTTPQTAGWREQLAAEASEQYAIHSSGQEIVSLWRLLKISFYQIFGHFQHHFYWTDMLVNGLSALPVPPLL